jgi:hypothetical protein
MIPNRRTKTNWHLYWGCDFVGIQHVNWQN